MHDITAVFVTLGPRLTRHLRGSASYPVTQAVKVAGVQRRTGDAGCSDAIASSQEPARPAADSAGRRVAAAEGHTVRHHVTCRVSRLNAGDSRIA